MARTIALLNMKGGVAKTTLAVNLAHHCYEIGNDDVLLIDLDPQFNASQYLMDFKKYDAHRREGGTIADLLIESPSLSSTKVTKKSFDNCVYHVKSKQGRHGKKFDLLPSELTLSHVVKNPHQMDYRLEKILENVRDRYDYIFIDCAPTDSVLTTMTLTASDYLLIPVKPDKFSIFRLRFAWEDSVSVSSELSRSAWSTGTWYGLYLVPNAASKIERNCMTEIRDLANADNPVFKSVLPVSANFYYGCSEPNARLRHEIRSDGVEGKHHGYCRGNETTYQRKRGSLMKQDEFKVVAELYQLLATFDSKAIAAATKLPNISDNLRVALSALHSESDATQPKRSSATTEVARNQKEAAINALEILTDRSRFSNKSELIELARLLGLPVDANPKESHERVAKKLAKKLDEDSKKRDEFLRLVSKSGETQTTGYFDLIKRGM